MISNTLQILLNPCHFRFAKELFCVFQMVWPHQRLSNKLKLFVDKKGKITKTNYCSYCTLVL